MMTIRHALILASVLSLAACGDEATIKRDFGLTRDAPDEFQVTTRAPLQMPSDFTLQPPRPGAVRPQELPLSQQAEAVLVPETALGNNTPQSDAEKALVAKAGPTAAHNIRNQVDSESKQGNSPGVVGNLMFWHADKPPGEVVDPSQEQQRLAHEQVSGPAPAKAVTSSTPESDSGGFFGWLF